MRPISAIPLSLRVGVLLAVGLAAIPLPTTRAAVNPHAKWEKEIEAFEMADRTNPPPSGGIVFLGSSSIRLWKTLAADFPGLSVINRGFGGSEMADSVYFADRVALKYRPRQILVYAGDNDLANGKTPEQISSDFQSFVNKVEAALPETTISYIAIKPSPSRWNLATKVEAANHQIELYTRTKPHLTFINVFTPMLGNDGRPREELFLDDKLHLNGRGYALWAGIIRPYLKP